MRSTNPRLSLNDDAPQGGSSLQLSEQCEILIMRDGRGTLWLRAKLGGEVTLANHCERELVAELERLHATIRVAEAHLARGDVQSATDVLQRLKTALQRES